MTVGGELNKLASNVAMGRNMGEVHWRSDNTRSLRLGETIAIHFLARRIEEYAETGVEFTFTSFNDPKVAISKASLCADATINLTIGLTTTMHNYLTTPIQTIHDQLGTVL